MPKRRAEAEGTSGSRGRGGAGSRGRGGGRSQKEHGHLSEAHIAKTQQPGGRAALCRLAVALAEHHGWDLPDSIAALRAGTASDHKLGWVLKRYLHTSELRYKRLNGLDPHTNHKVFTKEELPLYMKPEKYTWNTAPFPFTEDCFDDPQPPAAASAPAQPAPAQPAAAPLAAPLDSVDLGGGDLGGYDWSAACAAHDPGLMSFLLSDDEGTVGDAPPPPPPPPPPAGGDNQGTVLAYGLSLLADVPPPPLPPAPPAPPTAVVNNLPPDAVNHLLHNNSWLKNIIFH